MTGFKNYGPDVSQNPQNLSTGGDFAADGRSYEAVIIQENKPVVDWELNLRNQISSLGYQVSNQNKYPTSWLNGDYLESPNPSYGGSYIFLPATAGNENKFHIKSSDIIANGWNLRFDYSASSTPGLNEISLPAPPAASGRTDLVILEFWLALISPAPSLVNKSATALILRNGNVKAPDAVNLADDLIDPVESVETSKRVQLQYRYRVIQNVNIGGFPDGIDDTSVFAHGVSDFTGPGADGTVSAFNFVKHPTDSGLWVAGDGDSASSTSLGTVDGYVYGTPVCAIYRRNTTPFNRTTNMNGGRTISVGTSDRPDGLFADQIHPVDIHDLRRSSARSLPEVLEKATQQLFDNSLATRQETVSGVTGTCILIKEDIGLGTNLGNPDGVRRHYSDRSISETVIAQLTIGGLPQANATFNLSSIRLPFNPSSHNLLANAPAGTNISSVLRVRKVAGGTDTNAIASGIINKIIYSTNVGPGVDQVELVFSSTQTNATLYVEIVVEYPSGKGVTRNMKEFVSLRSPPASSIASWVDATQLTATTDVNRYSLPETLGFGNTGHREPILRLQTSDQTRSFITSATNTILVWERLTGAAITINDGINPAYTTTNYLANNSYTTVVLTGPSSVPINTSVSVTYKSYRAAPPVVASPGDSYQVYFRSAAIQSIAPPSGNQTLKLIPRLVDQGIHIMTSGSGGPDDIFPYNHPSEQIPVGKLPSPDFSEMVLDGTAVVSSSGFEVTSGYIRLPLVVPYVPNPAQVQLFRDAVDQVQDDELRNFWPRSQDPTAIPQFYSPVLFSTGLTAEQDHKVATTVLMELAEDFPSIGRKGQLVLVVFSNWLTFTKENKIEMYSAVSDSCASVFKVTGNVLNVRRGDV